MTNEEVDELDEATDAVKAALKQTEDDMDEELTWEGETLALEESERQRLLSRSVDITLVIRGGLTLQWTFPSLRFLSKVTMGACDVLSFGAGECYVEINDEKAERILLESVNYFKACDPSSPTHEILSDVLIRALKDENLIKHIRGNIETHDM